MSNPIAYFLDSNLSVTLRSVLTRSVLGLALSAFVSLYALNAVAGDAAAPSKEAKTQSLNAARATADRQEMAKREKWHQRMVRTPKPGKGCFQSTYPDTRWHPAPCGKSNGKLYLPNPGKTLLNEQVGGGSTLDFSAQVTGHISQAEGSFDSVNVTSETSSAGGANSYSLQLNTDFMANVAACSTAPDRANCRGWEQFVYDSTGSGGTQIQYWLLNWGPGGSACPMPQGAHCAQGNASTDGWCPQTVTGFTDVLCVVDAASPPSATSQPATMLGQLKVAGKAGIGSTPDSMVMTVGGTVTTGDGGNFFSDLGGNWSVAEFNVFGDGGSSQAMFNSGASAQVRTAVISGTTAGPACDQASFTAESNNLTLSNTAPAAVKGSAPALLFSEISPASGGVATCAAATSVGDTHLTTVDGLYYDFQASGDFVLAQTADGFLAEARQVSGAPSWPDATVNKDVATQMGKTRVAVCTEPSRLNVDGSFTSLADGKTLSLPSGVSIRHTGNIYLIVDGSGNSVRAEDNVSYTNVTVGLGHWPQTVHGILTNVKGHVNQIVARTGNTLTAPFVFADLYHNYADSWRVPAKESLLSVCSERVAESGMPSRPFYSRNLKPETYHRARGVCVTAGVKGKVLLDSCTLDVAVIGNDAAAKIFVGRPAPVAVGLVVPKRGRHGDDDDRDDHGKEGHDKN
jgi:hypothetical protein